MSLYMTGINECLQYHDMESIELYGANQLFLVDFGFNFLRSLPVLRIHNPSTTYNLTLDLRNNALTYIGQDVLRESIQNGLLLGGLLLRHNYLGKILEIDEGEIFHDYFNLRTLDLSHNEITSLTGTIFKHLLHLEHLNLSQNSLDSISFRFSHMTGLRHIDLTDNKISRLTSRNHFRTEEIQTPPIQLDHQHD